MFCFQSASSILHQTELKEIKRNHNHNRKTRLTHQVRPAIDSKSFSNTAGGHLGSLFHQSHPIHRRTRCRENAPSQQLGTENSFNGRGG